MQLWGGAFVRECHVWVEGESHDGLQWVGSSILSPVDQKQASDSAATRDEAVDLPASAKNSGPMKQVQVD